MTLYDFPNSDELAFRQLKIAAATADLLKHRKRSKRRSRFMLFGALAMLLAFTLPAQTPQEQGRALMAPVQPQFDMPLLQNPLERAKPDIPPQTAVGCPPAGYATNSCGLSHPMGVQDLVATTSGAAYACSTQAYGATGTVGMSNGAWFSSVFGAYSNENRYYGPGVYEPAFLTIDQTANNGDWLNWKVCEGNTNYSAAGGNWMITLDVSYFTPAVQIDTTMCGVYTWLQAFYIQNDVFDWIGGVGVDVHTVPWPFALPANLANAGNGYEFHFYCQAIGWNTSAGGGPTTWWVSNVIDVEVYP